VAQASVAWRDALFVTGGLRVERTAGALDAQVATLPMLGASWVRAHGDVSLKLRGAYGKGIRPPQTVTRGATWSHRVPLAARAHLEPESQSGVEVGADVSVGRALTLHLTRFDQRASGLVQPVTTVRDGFAGGGRLGYELQNVGAIDNRGWELQGVARAGALAVTGSLALVDSRVARLASGYRGDLRPGDRMLEVPARTMSLAATWTSARWSTTWGAARASDWINYDGLALGAALAGGTAAPRDFVGAQLRTYWREYAGVTRVRGALAYRVRAGTSLVLSAENLLDRQRGEPDNVTVLPGRTVLAGLRADF
jgi:iron complex outermembrane receptor protein